MKELHDKISSDMPPQSKLNALGRLREQEGELPHDWSEGNLQNDVRQIYDSVRTNIERLQTKTRLSDREAEAYVLHKVTYDQEALTPAGIALCLSVDGDSEVSEGAVSSYLDRAMTKLEEAQETYKHGSHPHVNLDEAFDAPFTVWVPGSTADRLENQARRRGISPHKYLQELLEEGESVIALETLLKTYRDAEAAQVRVDKQSLEAGQLMITAHVPPELEKPEAVRTADRISVDGEQFKFWIQHSPSGPQELGSITLYADEIPAIGPVSVEEGIDRFITQLKSEE